MNYQQNTWRGKSPAVLQITYYVPVQNYKEKKKLPVKSNAAARDLFPAIFLEIKTLVV